LRVHKKAPNSIQCHPIEARPDGRQIFSFAPEKAYELIFSIANGKDITTWISHFALPARQKIYC